VVFCGAAPASVAAIIWGSINGGCMMRNFPFLKPKKNSNKQNSAKAVTAPDAAPEPGPKSEEEMVRVVTPIIRTRNDDPGCLL